MQIAPLYFVAQLKTLGNLTRLR